MFSKRKFSKVLLIVASLFSSFFANASLTPVGDLLQVSILVADNVQGNSNDCSGYFGQGFEECKITHVPSSDTTVFAEIMGKFEGEGATQFAAPSQASDWNFDVNNLTNQTNPGENGTGTWNYTGAEYPGVSYWVAKAGSAGFILNWMIADNADNRSTCASPDEFSVSCLDLAVSVTTGAWTTPLTAGNGNSPIIPRNLSHISFYGNKCDGDCGPTTTSIPEPTSIALFALAFLGIAARRKNSTS
ncbi:PEP-CTERM sorting domain-containing protein [Colwellia sp. Bg11-28]|uniref:PEP-CTERM sorting domain-containing protein n=1 Tax=Colwellia sp. Bg11-28 TaxID=2058305 RepID=UPI000C32661E|nr:PEP-CTERM sorting domain-containing protein [Colwellia sp. Bg11-28]PKH86304.1 hypothetical protein CXF79_16450 [Colwellia sp. Bg11-28]